MGWGIVQPKPASVAYLYQSSIEQGQEPVRQARPHERIAQEIGEQIRDGRLVRGQKLPTEREMGERFGVGRGMIREAMRMLDAMGLVESRQGSGIYVRNNPIPSISRALTLSVTPEEQSVASLFEFRMILESAAAGQAACRRTEEQARAIARAAAHTEEVAKLRDGEAWNVADTAFHHAISEASGNPYLMVAIDAVRQMHYGVLRLIADLPGSATAAEQHRGIAAAIVAGDPAEAAECMRAHVQYTEQKLHNARGLTRERGVSVGH
jgi:GntR family transcriptional repressor for pyruvate dehydrogenase complex